MEHVDDPAAGKQRAVDSASPRVDETQLRASAATARGAQALMRLVSRAATGDAQSELITRCLAALYDGSAWPLDPRSLRTLDTQSADDVLACMDAMRWGRSEVLDLVPQGAERVRVLMGVYRLNPDQTETADEGRAESGSR